MEIAKQFIVLPYILYFSTSVFSKTKITTATTRKTTTATTRKKTTSTTRKTTTATTRKTTTATTRTTTTTSTTTTSYPRRVAIWRYSKRQYSSLKYNWRFTSFATSSVLRVIPTTGFLRSFSTPGVFRTVTFWRFTTHFQRKSRG